MLLHTLAKLQKFSVHTGLDAQTAQNAEFNTTKSLLIQDWVFRLGFHPYKYAMQYNATSFYYRQYKGQ